MYYNRLINSLLKSLETSLDIKNRNLFDAIKKVDENGYEYWLARELMPLLGYDTWKNFDHVIKKAITAFKISYPHPDDHFAEVGKKIKVGAGTSKEAVRTIKDYRLTRHACYLIAQNGDPKKQEIALAQSYFAIQTRKQELSEQKEKDLERLQARRKLRETEKKFSGVLDQHGVSNSGIAEIRSAGDEALFSSPTRKIKKKLGVGYHTPLADHLPTITLKAKDLAAEITTYNTIDKDLQGKDIIKHEHITNNKAVRQLLESSRIIPENLPAEEDIKQLEKKMSAEELELLEVDDFLEMEDLVIDIRSIRDKEELAKLKSTLAKNEGKTNLKIIYGSIQSPKRLITHISLTPEVISVIKPYLVVT